MDFEQFYLDLYYLAGHSITDVISHCKLHLMSNEEIIEAIYIINQVQQKDTE